MAKRSIKLNSLEDKFDIINEDILNLNKIYAQNYFDVVVTNPPYKKKDTGLINESKKKKLSRHEITATLEDFISISNKLLKDKGEFYMVHRPERIVDIIYLMRKYKIEPKELRMVCSEVGKSPKIVLIKGVKNAKPFIKIKDNIYIYIKEGKYTVEINKIYNNNIMESENE